tara:strand:+ start:432 stop:824 length:393 start_codon:yes stop_codon:yes gene_type:complete
VPRGSPNNIVGDDGLAFGWYQITDVMVQDYNRIADKSLTHEDAFDPKTSWLIAFTVLAHYSKYIYSLGYEVKIDHWLYIWNGGGSAWWRVDTPIDDPKQKNLERYRERARPFIQQYLNEKAKRRKPSERA